MRLSPLDSHRNTAFIASSLGHYQRGQYEAAAAAARNSVQAAPGFSVCHLMLAAALAKLGRLEDARAAAARILELQPTFRSSRQLTGVGCPPALSASLSEAYRAAGLPD